MCGFYKTVYLWLASILVRFSHILYLMLHFQEEFLFWFKFCAQCGHRQLKKNFRFDFYWRLYDKITSKFIWNYISKKYLFCVFDFICVCTIKYRLTNRVPKIVLSESNTIFHNDSLQRKQALSTIRDKDLQLTLRTASRVN